MYQEAIILLMPEIIISIMACIILMLDCSGLNQQRINYINYIFSLSTIAIAAIYIGYIFSWPDHTLLYGAIKFDAIGNMLKLLLCILLFFVFIYSKNYMYNKDLLSGDFFSLTLFSVLGMMLLVSCGNFLTLYLSLELFVLPIYALITMSQANKIYSEAAIKYFVMGALASGLLLYGISLLYGVTGNFDFNSITQELINQSNSPQLTLEVGMLFVLAGLAFKLGAVPFHMWLPDVYEGSPTVITLFLGTLPKLAAFGMAYRLLSQAFVNMSHQWQPLLIIMAVLSLIFGNVIAIAQRNIKRMLAYSTIAHIGFIMLGLITGPKQGYTAALLYIIIYVLMALGAFSIIIALSRKGFESDQLQDFKGLSQRHPWLAFIMLLLMFSMAGVPPTIGFYAKFLILQTIIQSNYIVLAIISLISSIIGAFYYLRVVWLMYFEDPINLNLQLQDNHSNNNGNSNNGMSFIGKNVLYINGLLILTLGIYPEPLIRACYFCTKI